MYKILAFIFFYLLGCSLIWVQTNGQFVWLFFQKNPLLISAIFGTIISYVMITATKYGFLSLGSIWAIKFVGFSLGLIVNVILNFYLMNEGVNIKTTISMILAFIIIGIQFWK